MSKLTRIVLIRVYADFTNPGYYSVLHSNNCITILPIIEEHKLRYIPEHLDPHKIIDKCTGKTLYNYYAYSKKDAKAIHWDPRIDLGFYTEKYYGRRLSWRKIESGDYILFMTGLARYPEKMWKERIGKLSKIIKDLKKRNGIGIYLIGGIVVEEKILIKNSYWKTAIKKYPMLSYSPHYYWVQGRDTYAIIGKGFTLYNDPLELAKLTPTGIRPKRILVKLIGRENAEKLVKQKFRKTGLINVRESIFRDIIPF